MASVTREGAWRFSTVCRAESRDEPGERPWFHGIGRRLGPLEQEREHSSQRQGIDALAAARGPGVALRRGVLGKELWRTMGLLRERTHVSE